MPLLQAFEATDEHVVLKFDSTVKLTTIMLSKFTLVNTNTSTTVANPFRDLVLASDYDSISRRLTLHFKQLLLSSTTYRFEAAGLYDVAGTLLPSATYTFTTGDGPIPALTPVPPEPLVVVEDHSIRASAFTSQVLYAAGNADFYIVSTDPEVDELGVEPSRNAGRITIKFSVPPAAHFVNGSFFKAQKKYIQRGPSRWITMEAQISLDAIRPWVYLDLPSTDAVPVYGIAGEDYFEAGFKYRVRISKEVGI